MAKPKPNNAIATIKLPGDTNARPIVPYYIGVSSDNNYVATLPSLTENATLALKSDIPSVLETGVSNKDKYLHTNASTGALEWSSVTGAGTQITLIELG